MGLLKRSVSFSKRFGNKTNFLKKIVPLGKKKFKTKSRNSKELLENSIHNALRKAIIVGQCFGVLPISGLFSQYHEDLNFRWTSALSLISCGVILTGASVGFLNLRVILRTGLTAGNAVNPIFFFGCTITVINFVNLAKRWPKIMSFWIEHEKRFLVAPYKVRNLKKSILLHASIIYFLAFLEHLMFKLSTCYNLLQKARICNITVDNWLTYYYKSQFGSFFEFVPYHSVTGSILEYMNISLTFGWNYMDLFVMLISVALGTRFSQFNDRIKQFKGQIHSNKVWEEVKLDYIALCELVNYVNDNMATIILLSCGNNLYFICYQLLNIFNELPYTINKLYFWYSLLYLIGRSMYVYLVASGINDASKMPIEVLLTIPSQEWCSEIERFFLQLRSETVALTGCEFFFMTRKLLFAMVGTVVTYELVLLQMDHASKQQSGGDSNSNTTINVLCD